MRIFNRTLLSVVAALSVAAPSASAQDGGTAAPGPTGGTAPAAADGQVAFVSRTDHLLGRLLRFDGRAGGAPAGTPVTIERHDAAARTWVPVAKTSTAEDGSFVARWRAAHIGRHRFRAVTPSDAEARSAQASSELAVNIFKPAVATWYGPGFYGRRTACGQRMSRSLLGVAHKRLPCGTPIALYYRGRTITVPVVDRGPYRRGTTWDLTAATAQAIGMTATSTIGAVTAARLG